ncbi:MAG: Rieske (2Fe-2S) protein [Deltaproteobacteria bacterium]|nr:MAG: Rieske (2Fe-2S) protein [Deltaproteobacteria bacterium]
MGLIRTLILGRPDGFRSRLCRRLRGRGGDPADGPSQPYTAPAGDAGWGAESPQAAEPAVGLQPEAPKDVTPPEGYEVVLHKDALPPGEVVEVIVAGKAIAVANADGTFYACTNTCPHAGGPLGEGSLDGTLLTCPYHGWTFDLADGSCRTNPDVTLETYDVALEQEAVCVRV